MVSWKLSSCLKICSFPANLQLWSVTRICNCTHLHNGPVVHSPCLQVVLLGFSFPNYSCCVCPWCRVCIFKLWESQTVSQSLAPSPSKKACFILGNPWLLVNQSLSERFLPSFQKFKCCFITALQEIFWLLFVLMLALCFRVGVLHLWFLFWKKAKSHIVWLCTSKGNTDSCLLDPFLSKPEDCISFDQGDVFFIPHTFLDTFF